MNNTFKKLTSGFVPRGVDRDVEELGGVGVVAGSQVDSCEKTVFVIDVGKSTDNKNNKYNFSLKFTVLSGTARNFVVEQIVNPVLPPAHQIEALVDLNKLPS